jgi:hypothetical protein
MSKSETKLTPIQQVKLAVSIPGTTTQTLMEKDFYLMYDSEKMVLYVNKKSKPEDRYVIHASNIAYLKL